MSGKTMVTVMSGVAGDQYIYLHFFLEALSCCLCRHFNTMVPRELCFACCSMFCCQPPSQNHLDFLMIDVR